MPEYKILNHPDKDEIIDQLVNGISPNKISKWMAEKYPDNKELQMTVSGLSDFRAKYLNLNRDAIRMLKREKKRQRLGLPHNQNAGSIMNIPGETDEAYQMRVRTVLLNSPTYQDKLRDITDAHLDAPRLIKELHTLLQSRIEVYYNEIATSAKVEDTIKADKMFVDYIRLATDVLKDAKKVWDDYNSYPEEGAIDVDVVYGMVGAVREAVKDIMSDFSPDLALEFMDKVNKRLSMLEYKVPKPQHDILDQVEKLSGKIKQVRERQ